jgi:hypothetical protein
LSDKEYKDFNSKELLLLDITREFYIENYYLDFIPMNIGMDALGLQNSIFESSTNTNGKDPLYNLSIMDGLDYNEEYYINKYKQLLGEFYDTL